MGMLDDLMKEYVSPWGEYTEEQKEIINKWQEKLEFDMLSLTPFRDTDFLENFLRVIPIEEQYKYVENTNNYQCRHTAKELPKINLNYVLVTRRAVYSPSPKPEQYWTEEHSTALLGLRKEIPTGSPQRIYSVIMVSTLQRLKEHGEPNDEEIRGGASDGEIMISSEPYSPKNFLFTYKPKKELEELYLYVKNGGMPQEELLNELKKNNEEKEIIRKRR